MSFKALRLILGDEILQKNRKSKLLIVGAGGIGCELLKSLSLSGFRNFVIIDIDTIQRTNLNRQFYFREHHVGKPKSVVVKESLLQLNKDLNIEALHANLFENRFDVMFFSQFDIIYCALDNIAARKHLAKMCTIAN